MKQFAITVLISILAFPLSVSAQPLLRLAADEAGTSCQIADPGPGGVVTVYVILRFSLGATGVSFSAPVPAAAGLTYAADITPFFPVGNSQTEVSIGFGMCEMGSTVVDKMIFARTGAGEPCVAYNIQPGATYTDCVFTEHSLDWEDGVALNSNGECNPVPIRNPVPANSATNVALATDLSWDDAYYICDPPLASGGTGIVYFGTSSNPPYNAAATDTHHVGPLSPSTKYYWRITNDYPSTSSPVWSFTTTNIVATTPSTWGAIKALYR